MKPQKRTSYSEILGFWSTKISPPSKKGFTLIELLVVVGVLAVLALLLLPAHASARAKARPFQCLNNMRQIMGAMMMYTADHHEMFPPNPDDGNTIEGHNWCAGLAGMGMQGEFNPDILSNPSRCLVAPYLKTNTVLFRCTEDQRKGLYQGVDPSRRGLRVPAARSIAMSQAVGTVCPRYSSGVIHGGAPTLPVNGPWLTGSNGGNNARTGPWRTYGKTSDMVSPSPDKLWIITEEDPYSINDGSFGMSAGSPKWIDFPSTLHNMGCVVGFGDGHVELHKWKDPSTRVTGPITGLPVLKPNNPDWLWLATRTSAKMQ